MQGAVRALLFNLILCAHVISAHAAEITSLDDSTLSLTSINSAESTFRPVKYCKDGNCELIPNENILSLQAFSEKDLDWNQIFNQCKNYKSLNQLYTWTQIISSVVVALKPITVLRNMRSTKNLLASWGFFGRVVGTRIVFESGISIAGQMVYSLPTQFIDNGDPYPEISPDDVELVSNLLEDVISESQDIYYLPTGLIEGMALILKGCTSQLKQEYTHRNASSCLTNCHSSKSKSTLERSRTAPSLNLPLGSPLSIKMQKAQLEDYLQ